MAKRNFKDFFNFYSNIFILTVLLIGGFSWAESNGMWTFAEDIKGGIFGLDQQPIDNYTFINEVYFDYDSYYKGEEFDERFKNDLNNVSCGLGEVLVGFNKTGDIICEQIYTYAWVGNNDWTACMPDAGVCGPGIQTQTVYCERNDGLVVSIGYCDNLTDISVLSCDKPCYVNGTTVKSTSYTNRCETQCAGYSSLSKMKLTGCNFGNKWCTDGNCYSTSEEMLEDYLGVTDVRNAVCCPANIAVSSCTNWNNDPGDLRDGCKGDYVYHTICSSYEYLE